MDSNVDANAHANASGVHVQKGVYARPRPEARSQTKQHSVSSLRSETGAGRPVDNLTVNRREAARMVRAWWKEAPTPAAWHMGRELSIWKRLVRLDGAELVNGAMAALPMLAPTAQRPYTLRLFYGNASTPLYEQCKAEWLKHQAPPRTAKPRTSGAPMSKLRVDLGGAA